MNHFNYLTIDHIIQTAVKAMKSHLQAMVIVTAVWWTIGLGFTLFNPGQPLNVIGWLLPIWLTLIGLTVIIFTCMMVATVVASITLIERLFPKQWKVWVYVPDETMSVRYLTLVGKVWSMEPSQVLAEKMLAKAKRTKFTPAMQAQAVWFVEFDLIGDSSVNGLRLTFMVGEEPSDSDFDHAYTDEEVVLDHHADMMLLQENAKDGSQ